MSAAALFLLALPLLADRPAPRPTPLPESVSLAQVAEAPGIVRWLWNFGDPSSGSANTSTLKTPVHVFRKAKTYTVTLTVWDSTGARSTARKSLTVRK